MSIDKFLERYNAITVGEDATSHYVLIHTTTEEPWATLPAPLAPEEFKETVAEISSNFPLGKQVFRVIAVSSTRATLAQFNYPFEGRSSAVKNTPAAGDHALHTRAMAANVQVAEQQLATMASRLETAERREAEAHERSANYLTQSYELVEIVGKMMNERESAHFAQEQHAAKMASIAAIGQAFMPVVGPLGILLAKLVEKKVNEKMKDWGVDPDDLKGDQP